MTLPEPAVPSDVYDETYYLGSCAGYEEWAESEGAEYAGIYPGTLARARLAPGEVLVDLGTGRGELLAAAIDAGAKEAIGVDYSTDAMELTHRTLEARGVGDRVRTIQGDIRDLPLEDGVADLVTLLDVVEHLAPGELDLTLREALRILRPGGRVLVHTAPNRTVYELTYRIQRLAVPGRARRWPRDPRNDYERQMHVNEQTRPSLRRALRAAGFTSVEVQRGLWQWAGFVPEERPRRLYARLARLGPLAELAMMDIWAEARRAA